MGSRSPRGPGSELNNQFNLNCSKKLESITLKSLNPQWVYRMNSKTSGLYIHIPFCLSKCPYCDFYSSTTLSAIPSFLEALFKEMGMYRSRFPCFDTIYLGGGTPSLLTPQQVEEILIKIWENFDLLPESEITIETNPADLNVTFLTSLREIGINRIHLGIQSFDEGVLNFLGRRHSVQQAKFGIESAREAGFKNMGMDLIYGVPGQDLDSWLKTLRQALAFEPEHLSCYQLTFEPHTPLGRRYRSGAFSAPGEALQYEFFIKTSECLEGAGYIHYEVSNFAKRIEDASRHNQKYWDHSPYLGLGPSAHSFKGNQRWWNHRSLEPYLNAIHQGDLPIEGRETLTVDQLRLEALYLGFRTKKGIDLDDFKNRYACDLRVEKGEMMRRLEGEGFVSIRNGHLSPTPRGFAIADRLALL